MAATDFFMFELVNAHHACFGEGVGEGSLAKTFYLL